MVKLITLLLNRITLMPKKTKQTYKQKKKATSPKRLLIVGLIAVAFAGAVALLLPIIQGNITKVSAGTCNYPGSFRYSGPAKPTLNLLSLDKELAKRKPKVPSGPNDIENETKYRRLMTSYNQYTVPSVKKSVNETNSKRKATYNTKYAAWSKAYNGQWTKYSAKLAAYNKCSDKLKRALNKAQKVVDARRNSTEEARKIVLAARERVQKRRDDVQAKTDTYRSYTLSVATAAQLAAQKAYNDANSAREVAKTNVTNATNNVTAKKTAVTAAQQAYTAKPTKANLAILDSAKAKLKSAKQNLLKKEEALRATWKPFKAAEAELAQKNKRLELVKKMDSTPASDAAYAALVKPRTDAKSALEQAQKRRDEAVADRDAKQKAFDKKQAVLEQARKARDAAKRAYDRR